MNTRLLVLLPALLLFAACSEPESAGGSHEGWLTDYDMALKESKASGKPVLVDFGAEW